MTSRPTVPVELASMLDQLAQTIVTTLGFGVAVINLTRPDGHLEVVSVAGDDEARDALLGSEESLESWTECLEAGEAWGRLRYLPAGRQWPSTRPLSWWTPSEPALDGPGAWHPDDALLAPLTASDGSLLGILSVDLPSDGRRPDTATRNALEAFAVSTALAVEHAQMRSRAEASEQALRSQAMSDPLTGIGTRMLIMERLRHAATARVESGVMALVFIDLDNFKSINDEHSHSVGDHVLCTVAERIQSAVRAHDTVARWGGDEFLVLLHPLADEHAALGVVQRILSAVVEPIADAGLTFNVTASIGVAFRSADTPVEPDELIRRADAAMYEVKRKGANSYAVFDNFDAEASRRLYVMDLLSRAVIEDRVVVHYQPIVRVADRRVVAVEALLRLRDDDSLVYPFELLNRGAPPADVAEAVLHQASEQVARWVDAGHDLSLAVNISAQQVADIEVFTTNVTSALSRAGLAPERLNLELTEHAMITTTSRMLAGIEELVGHGVRFSVDDFGTGFGSMTYVQQLPVHELKIDRSFLAAGPQEHAGRAIVRSIASLAAELGIGCVAEGVETVAQHELVLRTGVPLAQGLYYSPPLDAAALGALLSRSAPGTGLPSPRPEPQQVEPSARP